jgi:hypothetical protein
MTYYSQRKVAIWLTCNIKQHDWRGPMPVVIDVPAGIGKTSISAGDIVMRLPSWLERMQPVADQVGRGRMAGIEDEKLGCEELDFRQVVAPPLALKETRQDVDGFRRRLATRPLR